MVDSRISLFRKRKLEFTWISFRRYVAISVHRVGNYIVSYVPTNLVCLPDKWKASDVGQTFGGFTESQIRSSVSGSLTSLVKRVKVSLVWFSG